MDIKETLTHKLGPLPVWVWGVGAGVGINVARYMMNRNKATADEGAGLPSDQTGLETIGGGTAGVPSPSSTSPGGGGDPILDPTSLPATSNGAWVAEASAKVAKNGGPAVSTVRSALDKFLAGTALTPVEENLVDMARRLSGYPPEGAPAITRVGAPTGGGTVQTPTGPVQGTPNAALYNFEVWLAYPTPHMVESDHGVTASVVTAKQEAIAIRNQSAGADAYSVRVTPA